MQQTINALGYTPPLDVDGNYGRETLRAVEQSNAAMASRPMGLPERETVTALRSALASLEIDQAMEAKK